MLVFATSMALLAGNSALAQTPDTWTGNAGSGGLATWSTTGNWSSGAAPTASSIAVFDTTFTNQPKMTATGAADSIWLGTGDGQNVSLTVNTLTLTGTGTTNGNSSVAILLDDTSNHNLNLTSSTVTLANSTSFLVNNSGTLTIASALSLGSNTLTLGGDASGSTVISGAIGGSGGSIIDNSLGIVTLGTSTSSSNSFSGGFALNSGTLVLAAGEALTSTGTLTLGNSSGGSANATLVVSDNATATTYVYANSIVLGTTSGTLSIISAANNGGSINMTGAITGTNNLAFDANGTTHLNIQTGGVDITGTITNSGTGSAGGLVNISAVISGTATTIVQNSAATTLELSTANTFAGAVDIVSGTLAVLSSTALGTGTNIVTLGSGTSNGTFDDIAATGITITNPIVVNSTSGTNIIMTTTLGNNQHFADQISGTGNLAFNGSGGSNFLIVSGTINNVGSIAISPSGTSGVELGTIGSNVNAIIGDSSAGAQSVGSITVNSGTTTITQNGSTTLALTGGGP